MGAEWMVNINFTEQFKLRFVTIVDNNGHFNF